MRRFERGLMVLAMALVAVALTGDIHAGPRIKKTVAQCRDAYVILGWSAKADAKVWEKMGWVMYTRPHVKIASQHERGVAHKVSFRQYRVKGTKEAVAYVAHCGHGGTCNAVAERFFKWYKRVGVPSVYCGPLPRILEGAATPTIPKPDLTDYYKPTSTDDGVGDPTVDDFLDED